MKYTWIYILFLMDIYHIFHMDIIFHVYIYTYMDSKITQQAYLRSAFLVIFSNKWERRKPKKPQIRLNLVTKRCLKAH